MEVMEWEYYGILVMEISFCVFLKRERERTGLEWHECEKVNDDSFWVNYSFEFLFQWFIFSLLHFTSVFLLTSV